LGYEIPLKTKEVFKGFEIRTLKPSDSNAINGNLSRTNNVMR